MNTEQPQITEQNTEKTIENIDTVKVNTESVNPINTEAKTEKKPRKALSEESKQKRAEVLKKAREAKSQKTKEKKEAVMPVPVPISAPEVKQVNREDKILKKIKKEMKIEELVKKTVNNLRNESSKSVSIRNFF